MLGARIYGHVDCVNDHSCHHRHFQHRRNSCLSALPSESTAIGSGDAFGWFEDSDC
jgi:hypothetical protein